MQLHGRTLFRSLDLLPELPESTLQARLPRLPSRHDAIEHARQPPQLVVLAVPGVEMREVDELPESERGVRGFGSSAV